MRAITALLLAACTMPPRAIEPEPTPLSTTTMAEALANHEDASPIVGGDMLKALLVGSPATYTIRYARTQCAVPSGFLLPFLSCRGVGPTVGQPWVLDAWTKVDPATDTSAAWLVVGWQDFVPVDYSSWGMPGCWLLVEPKLVVYVPVGIDDGLVRRTQQSPGRIELNWTPPASAAGQTLWFQLLVAAPVANQFGLVTGPALRVQVGT